MKVPLSWLKEFIELPFSPSEIGDTLTQLGIEVEQISPSKVDFSGVISARILDCAPHPDEGRLSIVRVTDGREEYQVVCGASNCSKGSTVALATVGAQLLNKKGEIVTIKKEKYRGIFSEGMLCSSEELGFLSDPSDRTIVEFSEKIPLGIELSTLFSDLIFQLSLTPNLGHCLSILGIARELAAAYKSKVEIPPYLTKVSSNQTIDIAVEDPLLAPLYSCRIISDLSVRPSSLSIQQRLSNAGIRPINNLVDLSQYVMIEMGQPLHIFDLDTISGNKLSIKAEEQPFTLQTVDGKERRFPEGTLSISDQEKRLAIAGIIGGIESSVTEKTKNIIIESAMFDLASIRKTSRLLGIRTEAAIRFSRGIDRNGVLYGLNRSSYLIEEAIGGTINPIAEKKANDAPKSKTISLHSSQISRLLGCSLDSTEIISLLKRLEIEGEWIGELLNATIPSYRNDLEIGNDLIEELARLYGYNRIPRKKNMETHSSNIKSAPLYFLEQQLRGFLIGEHLQEWITSSLTSLEASKLTIQTNFVKKKAVHLLNAPSSDHSILRTSLLPTLCLAVRHNINHRVLDFGAFEIGKIYFQSEEKEKPFFEEIPSIGIILTGKSRPIQFDRKSEPYDFFDLKGVVESLLENVQVASYSFEPSTSPLLHPGRQAEVISEGEKIALLGEIHPELLEQLEIPQTVFFAELDIANLSSSRKKKIAYSKLPLFPCSERDWTIIVPNRVTFAQIRELIERERPEIVENFYLLNLYQNPQENRESYHMSIRFIYRKERETIAYETVEKEHQKLIDSVAKKLSFCL